MRPLLCLALLATAHAAGDPSAIRALGEFGRVCEADGIRLWGKSLCGPMVLVEPSTHAAIANRPDPDGRFREDGGVFFGTVPEGFMTSNTAVEWNGQQWATVTLPLPVDPYERLKLLAHESFHRIQPSLGLNAPDTPAAHLDAETGRLWLRLELRALAQALRESGPAGRASATDAMLFRIYRHRLCPGSTELEASMERQEGLAEYTGVVVALRATGESVGRVARRVESFEDSDAFARSFGYATGPALGLLLDRYADGWRARAASAPLDSLLISALQIRVPGDLPAEAQRRAAAYGYRAVAAAESEREERHRAMLSDLTGRFLDGAVLDFPTAPEMTRSFNPTTLIPFPPHGTYYPDGLFTASWGKLRVESGGALVAPDNRSVRVPAPADASARPVHGDGWALDIAPGWTVQPAPGRRGSFVVSRAGSK